MKLVSFFALFIFSVILLSCESADDSVLTSYNIAKSNSDSSNCNLTAAQNLLDLDDIYTVHKEINGTNGGVISIDTVIMDAKGNFVSIRANITFEPNSFNGTKNISISPSATDASIKFLPSIKFNKPAKLNFYFKGIDLSNLGFDSNSKVDFVYCTDDGAVERIAKNECKIKWDSKEMYVKNAKLQHFSRYIFVR